jgi:acyl-CoA reductase-like NAD-dependent aldehyde dehydrogenase
VKNAEKHGAVAIQCQTISEKLEGAYYPPTLLTNVQPEMRMWIEELFGPVRSVIPFRNEAEALPSLTRLHTG